MGQRGAERRRGTVRMLNAKLGHDLRTNNVNQRASYIGQLDVAAW